MSCGPEPTRFRLLRQTTYWEHDLVAQPDAEIGETIRLRRTREELDAVIDRHFLPPFLARGCTACDWYLTICDPSCKQRGLFRLVNGQWCEIQPGGCPLELSCPTAVAAAGDRVAVLDAGAIVVFARGFRRITRVIPFAGAGPIALDARGLVYAADGDEIMVFDRNGDPVRRIRLPAPVYRLAVDACGNVWIATETRELWRWTATEDHSVLCVGRHYQLVQLTGDPEQALSPLPATTVVVYKNPVRFCIGERCFDLCGQGVVIDVKPPVSRRRGIVSTPVTHPLDSFTPRCRWHRLRLDADIPRGTRIVVRVAVTDRIEAPDSNDWQQVEDAATDFLFEQPAGRYLHLEIELESMSTASPVIRSIRLDIPRSTSAEWLPAVYRDAPESSHFLEAFLSIFDATLEDLDRALECYPALLDPEHTPEKVLPWLASFVGQTLDPSWSVDRRRALLAKLPELYRKRGTPEGLRLAIEAMTGTVPVLDELATPAPFAALAPRAKRDAANAARVGIVRLFGRGRARARLGSSQLDATQLKSYGNPDDDARTALAFRVRLLFPSQVGWDLSRLRRLVEKLVPAHVVASIRIGDALPAVGRAFAVGIDTTLTGLPKPILGAAGNVRLRRRSALWPGASRGDAVTRLGEAAAVGIQTILR